MCSRCPSKADGPLEGGCSLPSPLHLLPIRRQVPLQALPLLDAIRPQPANQRLGPYPLHLERRAPCGQPVQLPQVPALLAQHSWELPPDHCREHRYAPLVGGAEGLGTGFAAVALADQVPVPVNTVHSTDAAAVPFLRDHLPERGGALRVRAPQLRTVLVPEDIRCPNYQRPPMEIRLLSRSLA
jgi:hypothetical protein